MDKSVKQLLEFGSFRVDPDQRLLLRDGQPIPLSPKAFDLLLCLLEHSGQVVLKDDLMRHLWPETFVEESNLGQHVFQLRKALGERPQDHSYIVTVPGRGYRFVQQVRARPDEEIVVLEARTQSRVVVNDRVVVGRNMPRAADLGSRVVSFPDRELGALPFPVALARRHKAGILAGVLAGLVIAGFAYGVFLRATPMPSVERSVRLTSNGRVEPFGPPLIDGSRIFFEERFGGKGELAQVSESGGEPSLVSTSIGSIALYDIDRRRGRLLVASEGQTDTSYPLWIVSTAGGSARRVGDALARDAAWSPDGQLIAYAAYSNLSVVGDNGQNPRLLYRAAGSVEHPRWSSDGSLISFSVRNSFGATSLWEINADGSDPHEISFGWKAPPDVWAAGECCVDFSPDGRYYLFRSIRDGVQSLWLVSRNQSWLHRTQPVQLYTFPGQINFPRFSPDSSKIFYVSFQERRELVRYDTAKKEFAPFLGGIQARTVNFSRDGQWAAYANPLDNTLWRSRVDGSEKLQLTFPQLYVLHPTWSPDGTKIAFEGSGRLYTISRDGGNAEPLLPEGTRDGQPSWSPDGKFLAFKRWSANGSIGLLDLKSRQVEVVPDSESSECPQWSPDGKYLAASNKKSEKLVLFDLATRKWSNLADGTPYGWGMRWSSDSKYVYYQHFLADKEQPIFRVRISDRNVEQITSSRQILRSDVLSFNMTGLTPDNAPLASFAHTSSDVFALELHLP